MKTDTPNDQNAHLFTTSQPRELLACVEFAALQSMRVSEDPGAFRWLTISLLLGVQNACLCALDFDDELGTKGMRYHDAKTVRRWTKNGRKGPEPRALQDPKIVSPLTLLERVGDKRFLRAPFTLPLSREMEDDFDALNDLRNTFIHFSDDGWTVDLREFPDLILNACKIIRHLAVTQPAYLKNAERGHRDRVAHALDTIETAMNHYDGQVSA